VTNRTGAGRNEAPPLARRIRSLEVSPTVAMAQRAAALRAQGREVLDFTVGEPDQPTPAHIEAAGRMALAAGKTRYAPAAGTPELRAAVVARYKEDFGLTFAASQAAITVGGKQAYALVCQALLERGDEVIVPAPYWPTFAEAVRLAGGRPVFVKTHEKDGFKLTARTVARAVGPRTKALVLNTPSNPTGAIVDPAELQAIARLARRRGFTVLYDDTYAHLCFVRRDPEALPAMQETLGERLTVIGTASKTYCMTGWRIGWVLGGRALVDACAALASHSTQSPTTFAQAGAVEALTGPQAMVKELCGEYERRRDLIHGRIAAIPKVSCVAPEGAFYVFPNLSGYLKRAVPTTIELGRRLLETTGVAVVPGEGFGTPGYLRISFARSRAELEEGARRIEAFLAGSGGW
jgi:aspartate aminotransferase